NLVNVHAYFCSRIFYLILLPNPQTPELRLTHLTRSISILDGVLLRGLDLTLLKVFASRLVVLLPRFGDIHRGILLLGDGISGCPTLHIRRCGQQKAEDEKEVKDTRTHDGLCRFLD